MMQPNSRRSSHQSGFTLVELMVGLAIGMLATLVIVQVISVFEAQSRSTTGSADAQTNGGIALYTISHDLQLAGYPLMSTTNGAPLACTTLTINGTADTSTPNRLSPVVITDGIVDTGDNASPSDAITIRYGDELMGGVPTQTQVAVPNALYPSVVPVLSNLGCQVGDVALVTSGTDCYMSTVTAVSPVGTTSPPPVPNVTLSNVPSVSNGINLACLGTWHEVTYRVNDGNLERCDLSQVTSGNCDPTVFPNTNFVPSVVGIVNLQAQYGISAAGLASSDPNYNRIVQWVDATAATGWNAPTVANRNRIKAVRLAVVARNAKLETSVVTSACSSTTAANPTGLCAWDATSALPTPPLVPPFVASPAPTIDLSASNSQWLQYRYRVFDTIIPLRNVIWTKD